jgi:hypothetical protein
LFAVPLAVLATLTPFHASTRPLSPSVKAQLKARGFWHKGCPVALSDLRLLTVNYRDRHGHLQTGRLVGWGWGGSWAGNTKDYMHFSSNGH